MTREIAVEVQAALRSIASLIGKSEKARQKLAPGSWQHTRMEENVRALGIASRLLWEDTNEAEEVTETELAEALRAFASMIGKTAKAQENFSPGTSQHTLLRNRLTALRLAEERVATERSPP